MYWEWSENFDMEYLVNAKRVAFLVALDCEKANEEQIFISKLCF